MKNPSKETERTAAAEADIPALRKRIDTIDDRILELINERLLTAGTIGRIKQRTGAAVVDSRREGEIYRRLLALNQGPLTTARLFGIFGSTVAAGRGMQHRRSPADTLPLYAVFGEPVGHSLSPAMHNSALAYSGLGGIYLAFRVTDIAAAVAGIRGLGIRGVSITIPHKVGVMKYLDEVDALAEEIGAVNTIVNRQGVLHGFNSDCAGAVRALLEKTAVKGRKVAIVGAGGGARAVGFGIKQEGGRITVINRSRQSGETLADDLGGDFKPLAQVDRLDYDIVVNATPVGMLPREAGIPLKPELLQRETVVMDMVYNPLHTRLLTAAEKIGCPTIDGVSMLVHQGAIQFELWTKSKAPVEIMRRAVLDELGGG